MREIKYESKCYGEIEVKIGKDIFKEITSKLEGNKFFITSNKLKEILKIEENPLFTLPDGEDAKDISNVLRIISWLRENGASREDYLISIGGGSVLDTAGFSASIYMRGMNLVYVPTTLLSMVDASIGGKVAVNFSEIKNIIGSFYPAKLIVNDIKMLESNSRREILSGIAEVLKYGFIMDKKLLDFVATNRNRIFQFDEEVLEQIIYRSDEDKITIVRQDEMEKKGVRSILNFGHTIGHAIESHSSFTIPHGLAISVGMVYETIICVKKGLCNNSTLLKIKSTLNDFGLPTSLKDIGLNLDLETAFKYIMADKKRSGNMIRLPIIKEIGEWELIRLPLGEFKELIRDVLL